MSYRQVLAVMQSPSPLDLSQSQRASLSRDSTAAFEQRVTRLAEDLAAGRIDLERWHAGMRQNVAQHMLEQATLGGTSGRLTQSQALITQASLLQQNKFLANFAAELEKVMRSEAYIANRSRMYAGAGIEEFWRAEEGRLIREHGTSLGWVAQYIAKDDDHTCPACLDAELGGPYLLGRGPLPGGVCYGRSRCRCQRRDVYDRAAWERLTGERLAREAAPVPRRRGRGIVAA